MGTVQAAIANGVLDVVRAGDIPKDKVNDIGIIYSVWLDPPVTDIDAVVHKAPPRRASPGNRQGDQKGDGQ
jgi:5,6,7,8-tetrahydromethanopterin hydro-lyase